MPPLRRRVCSAKPRKSRLNALKERTTKDKKKKMVKGLRKRRRGFNSRCSSAGEGRPLPLPRSWLSAPCRESKQEITHGVVTEAPRCHADAN